MTTYIRATDYCDRSQNEDGINLVIFGVKYQFTTFKTLKNTQ
ncbi:hypothetical protein [Aliarcobacter butzleri]|nr:hypothetical protein [Aliarcobacter butzleri]